MALNDDATLVINTGNLYLGDVDEAPPADLLAPGVAWTEIGHTSLEDIFGITSEGGEATTIGTLQNKQLRTTYSTRTETMTFVLQQWDDAGLKLYFGSNMAQIAASSPFLGVPVSPTPTQTAFLAVFVDGLNNFGIYVPKAEVFRNDDLSIADTESLAGLPLGVKPLVSGSNVYTYAVTPLDYTPTP